MHEKAKGIILFASPIPITIQNKVKSPEPGQSFHWVILKKLNLKGKKIGLKRNYR